MKVGRASIQLRSLEIDFGILRLSMTNNEYMR